MNNMEFYDRLKTTPENAKKPIKGGRISGFTDINPQYRIMRLTELFGPCGIGWYYTIEHYWSVQAVDEILCFVEISLYIKVSGEWSKPISGTGGNTLLAKETKGLKANDEAFKMAVTDAISVACKQLGIGADVYWHRAESKYNKPEKQEQEEVPDPEEPPVEDQYPRSACSEDEYSRRRAIIKDLLLKHQKTGDDYIRDAKEAILELLTAQEFETLVRDLTNKWTEQ